MLRDADVIYSIKFRSYSIQTKSKAYFQSPETILGVPRNPPASEVQPVCQDSIVWETHSRGSNHPQPPNGHDRRSAYCNLIQLP
jgi:hypothetical protein